MVPYLSAIRESAAEEKIPPLQLEKSKPFFWCHRSDLVHPSYRGRNGESHLPSSGQESQTTNKRFYLAAGYLSYKKALP